MRFDRFRGHGDRNRTGPRTAATKEWNRKHQRNRGQAVTKDQTHRPSIGVVHRPNTAPEGHDRIDVRRLKIGISNRRLDGMGNARVVLCESGADRIRAGRLCRAEPGDLGVDTPAPLPDGLKCLDHQNAAAFADQRAIRIIGERPNRLQR